MNTKKFSAFFLALLMLLMCLPLTGLAEATDMDMQEINVPNTPVKGKVAVSKQGLMLTGFEVKEDGFGNVIHLPIYETGNLVGATFEVRADEDIIGKDNTLWFEKGAVAAIITTTGDQADETGLLPLGKYTVTETEAPFGYLLDDTKYSVELKSTDTHTPVVKVGVSSWNDFLPAEIQLTKEVQVLETISDESGEVHQNMKVVPGKGFVFGLYNFNDIPYKNGTMPADSLIDTAVTDENGHLSFNGKYPHGEYYVRELSGPEGWSLMQSAILFDILPDFMDEADHTIRVILDEPVLNELIYTPVTLTKTNLGGKLALPHTWLELTDEGGEVLYSGYTDEHGNIPDMMLVPGKYTFREVLAPEGYELSLETLSFYVSGTGSVYGKTVISDDVVRFSVKKVDEHHEPLAGAEFGLKAADGTIVMTAVSDDLGNATFEMVPCGEYTIVELTPATGYVAVDVAVPVTVTPTYINPAEPLAVIDNCPNEVIVKKIDQDNKPLRGAKFGLFAEDGERIATAISDENGLIRFTKIPNGKYTIHEITAPVGYLLNPTILDLTMDTSWQNTDEPIAVVKDHLKQLLLLKVDSMGNPMADVEFSLINAETGEIAETVRSNADGAFTFTAFDYGDWLIHENAAPAGYAAMADIPFHVGEDWVAPKPIICVNVPDHFELLKTDTNGKPLAGVKFRLEDAAGADMGTYTSGEDGIVHVTGLKQGTYFLKEIETLKGYTLSGEVIKIVLDEHYALPDKMMTMVNYTTIQTGVNMAITGVMWAGIALILISGTVFIIRKRKNAHK